MVDDGGHAVVGRKSQELGIELIASADVDRLDRVIEARLPEKEGGLVAGRRRAGKKVKHRSIRNQSCGAAPFKGRIILRGFGPSAERKVRTARMPPCQLGT